MPMIGTIGGVALAAAVFVASHIVLSSTPLRGALVGVLGAAGFRGTYSAVALAALVWLVAAHGAAPYVEIWGPSAATRHLSLVVMPFAAVLLVAGVTVRNPAGMMAPAPGGDPAPGILKVTRHPVIWAIALWALAHMAANGDAASLLLFGALALLALAGMPLIDRRKAAELGADWGPILLTTSVLPFAAMISGRARFRFAEIGVWRVLAGVALYLALLLLHGPVIGRTALPG